MRTADYFHESIDESEAVERWENEGGRTSSIRGPITGFTGWTHHGATKAGVLGFMRSAAIEFARHNGKRRPARQLLASDEAKYIRGQTLVVDSGQTLPESVSAV